MRFWAQRFRQLSAIAFSYQQLRDDPPVLGIGVEQRFSAIAAVETLHPFGWVLKLDQAVVFVIDLNLLFLPSCYGMIRDLEEVAAIRAVTKTAHDGLPIQGHLDRLTIAFNLILIQKRHFHFGSSPDPKNTAISGVRMAAFVVVPEAESPENRSRYT